MEGDGKEESYYQEFMVGLLGLMDDANISNYNYEGCRKLREAYEIFKEEFEKKFHK
nr:hypothetical protein [Sphingomonas sp. Y57]